MEATAVKGLIDLGSAASYVNERREYIGASSVGDPCDAYLALCLRGFESEVPSAKLIRIFRDGHRIEEQVISDMRKAGLKVLDRDPETGGQWRYTALGGLMSASLDGIVFSPSGEEMTLEIKSMNRAMFAKFADKGLSVSHPHYVVQMNAGLGLAQMSGRVLSKGMMVAYCKDTSEYHVEVIDYDSAAFDKLFGRVAGIVSDANGKRISAFQNAYNCKQCFKRTACWEPASMQGLGCKQCAHACVSTDSGDPEWSCQMGFDFGTRCQSFRTFQVGK